MLFCAKEKGIRIIFFLSRVFFLLKEREQKAHISMVSSFFRKCFFSLSAVGQNKSLRSNISKIIAKARRNPFCGAFCLIHRRNGKHNGRKEQKKFFSMLCKRIYVAAEQHGTHTLTLNTVCIYIQQHLYSCYHIFSSSCLSLYLALVVLSGNVFM